MEMDDPTLNRLREMAPRDAYESVKWAVLRSPWGSSSADLHAALEQVVQAGILTWDEIEAFEGS